MHNMTPNWLKIDKNNLPKGEVVAVNFELKQYWYIKHIGEIKMFFNNIVVREYEGKVHPVTHYLPLPKDEEREG